MRRRNIQNPTPIKTHAKKTVTPMVAAMSLLTLCWASGVGVVVVSVEVVDGISSALG
jgi:hypothetical protein